MFSGRAILRYLGIFLTLAWATCLYAQLNRGVIEGTATDPQGAVVPGVDVTVTAVDTNVSQSTRTNSAGSYRVVNLVPGSYRAHFAASGFTALDINDVAVSAGEVIRLDASLRLGATRETVQVTSEVPLLETSAANFSTTLGTNTIQDIPLAGRDLQQLVNLLPGVNNSAGPPGTLFGFNSAYGSFPDPTHAQGSDLSVNGGQGGANAWYLDGNLDLSGIGENMAVDPSPDAVSEFQAITNSFSAEYGRTGGAIFNVVLKSGTNRLHGDVYEFLQNNYTNARNPFTSIDALGNIIPQHQLRYNDFGGTVGGPVYLPHLYNGKDKTFFFLSWDAAILHLTGSQAYTVPTPLMRQGIFSEDANVTTFGLWNPYSTIGPATDGTFARSVFGTPITGIGCTGQIVPGGAGGTTALNPTSATCKFSPQIPSTLLSPTAMFYINSFPLPNFNNPLSPCPLAASGAFPICQNYLGTVGTSQDSQNISLKIDEHWSSKSSIFGEFLFNPGKYNNFQVPWKGPTFPQDTVGFGSQYPFDFANTIVALGNTYTLSPTLINEFRLSFGRQYLNTHPSQPYPDSVNSQSVVQQLLAPLNIPENKFFPVPHWNMTSPGSNGSFDMPFGPTSWTNMVTGAQSYTLLDNITRLIGRHTVKTGFMYRRETTFYQSGFPTGFGLSGQLVQNPNTGQGGSGLAQFMLGAISNANRDSSAGVMWSPTEHFGYWGLYGQDDFRITSKFTLNLGLRWDLFEPFWTLQTPLSNFCLVCPNSTTGLLGETTYQGTPQWPGGGRNLGPANKNDFGPRLNFSWAAFPKTVIRGGYDVFFSNAFTGINEPGQGAANAPGWNQEFDWNNSFYPQCAPFSGQCVAFPLDDTSTTKANLSGLPSTFPAANRSPLLGISLLQFFTPPDHDPMVQTWNLEVERELPADMFIRVGYVGTHGTHLLGEEFRQFNFIPIAEQQQLKAGINASVPITQIYSGQTAAELQQVYKSSTLPLTILLKPYPFYGATAALQNNTSFDGTSIYHSFQFKIQKRPSHGVGFVVAYTASKNIDNASTAQLASGLVDPIHFARGGNLGGRAGAVGGLSGGGSSAVFGGAIQDFDNRKVERAISADDIPQLLNAAVTYELPFGLGKPYLNRTGVVNALLGGWQLTPNLNAESGLPLAIACPSDQVTFRCDLIGNPHFSGSRTRAQQIAQWMNPAAFQPAFGSDPTFAAGYNNNDPRAYLLGTTGPRLPQIRSPGFWNADLSLAKQFRVRESAYFQFRWDLFNAFNHQNLAIPNTNWCLPPLANGNTDKIHVSGCAFGQITNIQSDPRSMQFALKFFW